MKPSFFDNFEHFFIYINYLLTKTNATYHTSHKNAKDTSLYIKGQ